MNTRIPPTPLLTAVAAAMTLAMGALQAQTYLLEADTEAAAAFDSAIRPITSPVYFDSPLPLSNVHPIFMYQELPSTISTTAGNLPLGGDFQLYALQAELALTETISLVAAKDGYIVFHPDNTLINKSGWANLAGGAKWAFYYDPEDQLVLTLRAIFEFPTGTSGVFQGGNYMAATPSLAVMKLWGDFQVIGQVGTIVSLNDAGSNEIFTNLHLSYNIEDVFYPLIEFNYFHVTDTGSGGPRFSQQAGGAVPSIVTFEGGDLINFGASNAGINDVVTLGLGFRVRAIESLDVGFAFEFPLNESRRNLMELRTTVDAVWRF